MKFTKGAPQHELVTPDLMGNAQDADIGYKPSRDTQIYFPYVVPTVISSPSLLPHRPTAWSKGQQQLCWRQMPTGSHQWPKGGIRGHLMWHQPGDCFTSEMSSWWVDQSGRELVCKYFSHIVPFIISPLYWVACLNGVALLFGLLQPFTISCISHAWYSFPR